MFEWAAQVNACGGSEGKNLENVWKRKEERVSVTGWLVALQVPGGRERVVYLSV